MPQTTPFLIFIKQAVVQEGNFCGLKDFVLVSWWLRAQGVKPLMGHTNYIGVDYFSGKCFRKRGSARLSRNISKFRSIHTDGIGGSCDCFGSACSLVQHHSLLRWMFYDFIAPELVKVLCLLWTLESVLATASFDESAILMSQPYRARTYPTGQIPSRKNNHGP